MNVPAIYAMPRTQTIQPNFKAFAVTTDAVYNYNVFYNGYFIGQIDELKSGNIIGCDYFDSHINDYIFSAVDVATARLA